MDNGFEITVPADTEMRTLNLYLGAKNARGLLQATLSDGSANDFTALIDQQSSLGSHRVNLNYAAASAGQNTDGTVYHGDAIPQFHHRQSDQHRIRDPDGGSVPGGGTDPNDGSGDSMTSDGGVLAGSAPIRISNSVNLTAEGVADWTQWSGGNNLNRKAGVAEQISDFTLIGDKEPQGAGTEASYTWSDGTHNSSGNTSTGTRVFEIGNGFEITVPADTSMRTLRVYVGAKNANGRLAATLSDNSAPVYSTLVEQPSQLGSHVVEISYQAAELDQTLTVRYLMDMRFRSGLTGSQINIEAATLQ